MLNIPDSDLRIIDELIEREGGFVNHSADRGGATKFGVTAQTLGAFRELGRDATVSEVAAITESEAQHILYSLFAVAPKLTQIYDSALRALLIDSAVHSGPMQAVKWLQRALGVSADGIFGPKTQEALELQDSTKIYKEVLAARVRFIGRLIADDPTQAVFAAGWMNRLSHWISQTR